MVALQTAETVVPGSNPASLTVENSGDRQSHCVYCTISGQRGRSPPEAKKDRQFKVGLSSQLSLATRTAHYSMLKRAAVVQYTGPKLPALVWTQF